MEPQMVEKTGDAREAHSAESMAARSAVTRGAQTEENSEARWAAETVAATAAQTEPETE